MTDFLPIGTVCLLKGGTKKVMIAGYCAVPGEGDKKMYDYCGCIFPEGFLDSSLTCLFDKEQISQIFHLGYDDNEAQEFKKKLRELIKSAEDNNNTEEILDI